MSTTAYDDWLASIREDNETLPGMEEQQAFLDFLNHKTSAEEAAVAYTRVQTNAEYPSPDTLWLLLWQAAQAWPETHEDLIELLKAISRLPPIPHEGNTGLNIESGYWSVLPYFGFELREYYDGQAGCILDEEDPKLHAGFINLTSFNASLFRHNIFELERWALMTLSNALEEDYGKKPHLLDTWVPAAAQYILQTGPAVYKCDKGLIFDGPLLEKAKEQGPVERWEFWKEKFASVQHREDLKESTRATAKQVVERMEVIEKESH